eukprot:COSAG04_NODE_274_length_18488_cov_35.031377_13_plen_100_part_00
MLCRWCSGEPKEVLRLLRSAMEHTGEEDNTPFTFSEDVAKAALANDLAAGAQKKPRLPLAKRISGTAREKAAGLLRPFPAPLHAYMASPASPGVGYDDP